MGENKEGKRLPPGFRFHPTDEELVTYYLANKALDGKFTGKAVADVDLNKCEPWDLPGKAKMGEDEWYFFSLRDRKYPTGIRTNRTTNAGYWKTTGKDKEVVCSSTSEVVGFKKTLVFYMGRAPRGQKTNWVIHEYRLLAGQDSTKLFKDEWVLCRVFQKGCTGGKCHESSPRFHPYSLGNIQLPPPAAVSTQGIDNLCNIKNGIERSNVLNLAELTRIFAGNFTPVDQQLHCSSGAPVAASGCNQGFPFPGPSVSLMEPLGASLCQNQLAMSQVNPLSTIGYALGASKQHTNSFNEYQDMHGYWASF